MLENRGILERGETDIVDKFLSSGKLEKNNRKDLMLAIRSQIKIILPNFTNRIALETKAKLYKIKLNPDKPYKIQDAESEN